MSFRRISKTCVCMLALAVSILFLASCPKPQPPITPNTVSIRNNFFSPDPLPISAGVTVTWQHNAGNRAHTVTSGNPGAGNAGAIFDSRRDFPNDMRQGDTFSHTFNNAGTFPYHCRIHGGGGMTGTVTVN